MAVSSSAIIRLYPTTSPANMAASLRSIAHPTVIHPAPLNLGRIGASSNHVFLFDGPRVGVWQGAIGCRVQQQAPALKKPFHRLAKPKRLMQAVGSLPALGVAAISTRCLAQLACASFHNRQ